MSELYENIINDLAEEVKQKIKDGKIFGVKVDMNNINHLIILSYLLGQMESFDAYQARLSKMLEWQSE